MKKRIYIPAVIATLLALGTIHSNAAEKNDIDKTLDMESITFHVQASDSGSLNQLTVIPEGLEEVNRPERREIEGSVTGIKVADLNRDGFPELYIFVTSAGSGSYGSLVAYSVNHKKSMSDITLPELDPKSKEARGYMGHDRFSIDGHYLVRSFPVYKKGDPNCCPTGGERRLYYKLIPGEAGWLFKLVKSETVANH